MEDTLPQDNINELPIKEQFQKPKRLGAQVGYITGIQAFDRILGSKPLPEIINLVTLKSYPNDLLFELKKDGKTFTAALPYNKIMLATLEDKVQNYQRKKKSIVGRAILGGLLAGATGAIIGGLSGIGSKKIKEKMPDLLVSIHYLDVHQAERMILLSCPYKSKKKVSKFLADTLPKFTNDKSNP